MRSPLGNKTLYLSVTEKTSTLRPPQPKTYIFPGKFIDKPNNTSARSAFVSRIITSDKKRGNNFYDFFKDCESLLNIIEYEENRISHMNQSGAGWSISPKMKTYRSLE